MDNETENMTAESDDEDFSLKEIIILFMQILPLAFLFALCVRIFLFQTFFIPSRSMVPSLRVGDHLLVSKYAYGYSRYSFPLDYHLFSGRFWSGRPKRGDVAVFRIEDKNYIKRVIGLPGDRVQMKEAVLFINDKAVQLKPLNRFVQHDRFGDREIPAFAETLPNGVRYRIIEALPNSNTDNTKVFTVPKKHYFMMGDNRDMSNDSRSNSPIGFVNIDRFIGRAEFIFFSRDADVASKLPFWQKIRWSRIFKWIS